MPPNDGKTNGAPTAFAPFAPAARRKSPSNAAFSTPPPLRFQLSISTRREQTPPLYQMKR
ncbi:hypothetical protein KSP40_PGU014524 [Platanthera guangdongensis]|uniref:Uncharacterized protein n=1 Tax=Platanthera guangdongensis TaxID=2320717 RepID=A0ABR2MZ92_9ASPA